MKKLLLLSGLILGACNTLESTEVATHQGTSYVIKVSEYDEGMGRSSDIFINDKLAMAIKPTAMLLRNDPYCEKTASNPITIVCTYIGEYDQTELKIVI